MQSETRKLQKVGGSTYTVSVPKYWADRYRLEAGSEVHVYTYGDGTLVVRASKQEASALDVATVECETDSVETVERALTAAYAAGFETIVLVADGEFTSEHRRRVNAAATSLVGMQVVEESAEEITVRSLLDASEVSVRQSVVQLQFLTLSMHGVAVEAIVQGDAGGVNQLTDQDAEVDRLVAMTSHHFNRSLSNLQEVDRLDIGRPKLFDYYLAAHGLARIADQLVTIVRVVDEREADVSDDVAAELRELAFDTRSVIEAASNAVVNGFSMDDAERALDERDAIVAHSDAIDEVLFDHSPEGTYYLTKVTDALVRSADAAGDIAEVALQGAIREGDVREDEV